MKKLLLKLFTWFFWKHFHVGLKSVLGHKTLSASIKNMNDIEAVIRLENNLKQDEVITWENSKATDKETFARYFTLKHFNEIGELLALFRVIGKKKILEVS
jgi:hypothetical protein